MNKRFLFREPNGTTAEVGVLREVLGKLALVNDQLGGRTETWIHKFNAPMAFSEIVTQRAKELGAELVVARTDRNQVFVTGIGTLQQAKTTSLRCERQHYLPVDEWRRTRWEHLQTKPVLRYDPEIIDVPVGTFSQRRMAA